MKTLFGSAKILELTNSRMSYSRFGSNNKVSAIYSKKKKKKKKKKIQKKF